MYSGTGTLEQPAVERPRMATFDQFWPFYLGEHSRNETKWWHTLGTGIGIVSHFILMPLTRSMWWFVAGFVAGYACAWYSHFCLEKNRPATFRHPYWSFFSDIEQFFLMLSGWMPWELERLKAGAATSFHRNVFRVCAQSVVWSWTIAVLALWRAGWLSFAHGPLSLQ